MCEEKHLTLSFDINKQMQKGKFFVLSLRACVCVCVEMGGSVSHIWEEANETKANLITVWATFSALSPNLPEQKTHADAAFSSRPSESHGLRCVGSVSTDRSIETAFVLLECKMDSVSEGWMWGERRSCQIFLPRFVCIIVYVRILHIIIQTLARQSLIHPV